MSPLLSENSLQSVRVLFIGDSNECAPETTVRLHRVFCALAMILAAVQAWVFRGFMNADGIAYLDLSDTLLTGNWRAFPNGLWSPLYPGLIASFRRFLSASAAGEFAAVHFANFILFCAALLAFRQYLESVLRTSASRDAGPYGRLALTACGYLIFIWGLLDLIQVAKATPDLCVATVVFIASANVLLLRRAPDQFLRWLAFGVTLGFGYLAKAAVLPLAPVYFVCAAWPFRKVQLYGLAFAAAGFLLPSAPFMFWLSTSKGRFTIGDAGRVNYAWHVNGVPNTHWYPAAPDYGTPVHRTRRIWERPPVYEFDGPVGGTYPVGSDPSYWYEGVRPRVSLEQQAKALIPALRLYGEMFFGWRGGLIVMPLIIGVAMLFAVGGRNGTAFPLCWPAALPAAAALAMYSLVHVESRYVAPFIVVLLTTAAALASHSGRGVGVERTVWRVVLTCMLLHTAGSAGRTILLAAGETQRAAAHYQIANRLAALGLRPNDAVAHVGDSYGAIWARVARLRIVAEISLEDEAEFWAAAPGVKAAILERLSRTSARALIVTEPPEWASMAGWTPIPGTRRYVCFLSKTPRISSGLK